MEMLEGSEGSGSISCGTGVFLIDARRTSETSVNALFNAELRYLVETFNAAEVTETKTSLSYSIFPWAAAVVAKKAVASARALVGHCR
ncbi:hypothetical protein [Thiocapsa roseopersicina]|nr:hypothetical protein [Thiocapsa roseopersicina]